MRTSFRLWLSLAAWLGCTTLASADNLAAIFTNVHTQVALPRRTSIILIEGHGIGFGDLSCYGQTNFQTPNLDQLAAGGIRFNHYTAGAGTNYEGQTWLMTGNRAPGVSGRIVTVAQMLKDAGYSTGFIGEWLQAGQPWESGFDEFAGFLKPEEGTDYYAGYMWRFSPSTIYNHTAGKEPIYPNNGGARGESTVDFFFKMAMNYVRLEAPARSNHHRPFFLVLNLPTPRSARAGADEFSVTSDAPYSEEPWPQAAKNRAALLARLDDNVGRLFEQLGEVGMTNNVAVFFTSSAPPEKFADPRLDFFRATNDVLPTAGVPFEAPMLVRWPGHIPAGQVSDQAWSAADFLPTAAEIAFLKPPENVEGHSVLPLLLNQKTP